MSIAENIGEIRRRMAEAAKAAGREDPILLVGASKMNDADACRQAIAAGIDALGENRVQELLGKYEQGAYEGAPLHFIGHLQRNKVRQIVGKVSLIHSVSSLELLDEIQRQAEKQGITQAVLLEVNIGGEESKSGFAPDELEAARRSVVGSLRTTLDAQGRLEEYWLNRAVSGTRFAPEELAEAVKAVSREDVVQVAQRVQLDSVYTLRGKEG